MTAESSANWIPHSTNDRRSLVSHPLYTTSGGGTISDPVVVPKVIPADVAQVRFTQRWTQHSRG